MASVAGAIYFLCALELPVVIIRGVFITSWRQQNIRIARRVSSIASPLHRPIVFTGAGKYKGYKNGSLTHFCLLCALSLLSEGRNILHHCLYLILRRCLQRCLQLNR
jgi:hypothetical protein